MGRASYQTKRKLLKKNIRKSQCDEATARQKLYKCDAREYARRRLLLAELIARNSAKNDTEPKVDPDDEAFEIAATDDSENMCTLSVTGCCSRDEDSDRYGPSENYYRYLHNADIQYCDLCIENQTEVPPMDANFTTLLKTLVEYFKEN